MDQEFVTPPQNIHRHHQQSQFVDHSVPRDSFSTDVDLLDGTLEDDETTPGLPLAGSTVPVTAEVRRQSTEKAMLEATLTNLRSKLADVERDDWLYDGPRYSYS